MLYITNNLNFFKILRYNIVFNVFNCIELTYLITQLTQYQYQDEIQLQQ